MFPFLGFLYYAASVDSFASKPLNTPVSNHRWTALWAAPCALLGGCGLVAALQAWWFPGLDPTTMLRAKLIIMLSGNLLVGVVLAALMLLVHLLRRQPALRSPAWRSGRAFWLGVALGVGPLLTSTWATTWAQSANPSGFWAKPQNYGYLAMLGMLVAAPFLGRATQAGHRLFVGVGLLAILGYGLLWALPGGLRQSEGVELRALEVVPGSKTSVPDIVLISVDTLRADSILDAALDLPNLDRLRKRGKWADYGLAPAPSTVPSHTTMLTGLGVLQHGARSNEFQVPQHVPMVSEKLADAGYRTVALVSTGVLRGASGFRRGFEVYDDATVAAGTAVVPLRRTSDQKTWLGWLLPEEQTVSFVVRVSLGKRDWEPGHAGSARGERTTPVAKNYLKQLQSGEQAFFFFLHFMDPHLPYTPHASVQGQVVGEMDVPSPYNRERFGSQKQVRLIEAGLRREDPQAQVAADVLRAVYMEEVLYIDQCIGAVLDQLEQTSRDTVILFTADHGEQFGEHQRMLHANSLYEPLLRVPFILVGPDIQADSRFTKPPHLEDVAPTLLNFAGLSHDDLPGRNLRSWKLPQQPQIAADSNKRLSIRDGKWKLIGIIETMGETRFVAKELFDIEADPQELNNVMDQFPEQVERLKAGAGAALANAYQGTMAELSQAHQDMMSELGYGGDEEEDAN